MVVHEPLHSPLSFLDIRPKAMYHHHHHHRRHRHRRHYHHYHHFIFIRSIYEIVKTMNYIYPLENHI